MRNCRGSQTGAMWNGARDQPCHQSCGWPREVVPFCVFLCVPACSLFRYGYVCIETLTTVRRQPLAVCSRFMAIDCRRGECRYFVQLCMCIGIVVDLEVRNAAAPHGSLSYGISVHFCTFFVNLGRIFVQRSVRHVNFFKDI